MDKVIAWTQKKIEGTVILPASKSESNRALVLSALAGGGMPENLSDSDDTRVLAEALKPALPCVSWQLILPCGKGCGN